MSNMKRKLSVILSTLIGVSSFSLPMNVSGMTMTENIRKLAKGAAISAAVGTPVFYFYLTKTTVPQNKLYLTLKPAPEITDGSKENKKDGATTQSERDTSISSTTDNAKKEKETSKEEADRNPFKADYTTELEKVLKGNLTNYGKYEKDVYELYRFSKLMEKALERAKRYKINESLIDKKFKKFLVHLILAYATYDKGAADPTIKKNDEYKDNRILRILAGYDKKQEVKDLNIMTREALNSEIKKARKWLSDVRRRFDYDWIEMARRIEGRDFWGTPLGDVGWNLLWQTKVPGNADRVVEEEAFISFSDKVSNGDVYLDKETNKVKFKQSENLSKSEN